MKSTIELTSEFCHHYENSGEEQRQKYRRVVGDLFLFGCVSSAFITKFDKMTDCALEPSI